MERISKLESKLSTQEETSSEHGAVGAGEGKELGHVHCFQPAAYHSSVDGYGQQLALVDTGTCTGTAQQLNLYSQR